MAHTIVSWPNLYLWWPFNLYDNVTMFVRSYICIQMPTWLTACGIFVEEINPNLAKPLLYFGYNWIKLSSSGVVVGAQARLAG